MLRKTFLFVLVFVFTCTYCIAFSESATEQLQEMYAQAELKMALGDYAGAAESFEKLGSYSDCSQMAMYCKAIYAAEDLGAFNVAIDALNRLEDFKDCKQLSIYYTGRAGEALADSIIGKLETCSSDDLKDAKKHLYVAENQYSQLSLFKDCITRITSCNEKKAQIDQEIQKRENASLEKTYNKALKLENEERYMEAIEVYQSVSDYKDSSSRINICKTAYKDKNYKEGEKKREELDWDGAVEAFERASATEQIQATRYAEGLYKKDTMDWEGAVEAFTKAGNYNDAEEQIKATRYQEGCYARENQKWEEAEKAFKKAGDYRDAKEQIKATKYDKASVLETNGDQEGAYKIFIDLGEYSDSYERANKPYYDLGVELREKGTWDEAIAAFKHAGKYNDAEDQVFITYYAEGNDYMEQGAWEKAIKAFEQAGEYSDASNKMIEARYNYGIEQLDKNNYDNAIEAFTMTMDYKESEEFFKESSYKKAVALYDNKQYGEAVEILSTIKGYKESDDLFKKAQWRTIGGVVRFGHYEQDDNSSNGPEEIEWYVYDVKGNSAMLLSRCCLDCKQYNSRRQKISWEKCSLRSWLNKSFLKAAFSKDEQAAIITTTVDNSKAQAHPTFDWCSEGGKDTKDKIFILSYQEDGALYSLSIDSGESTEYAISECEKAKKANKHVERDATRYYWLRNTQTEDASLNSTCSPCMVDFYYVVRPALWVDLDSPII